MTILENIGELPHLVRRGTASISIRLDSPRPVTIWAVDLSGKRQKKMPFRQDGTVVRLTVETIQPEGTFLAYELVTGDQP